jgi:hypothetical protein
MAKPHARPSNQYRYEHYDLRFGTSVSRTQTTSGPNGQVGRIVPPGRRRRLAGCAGGIACGR